MVWKYVTKIHSISNYLLNEAKILGLSETVPYSIITPAVALKSLPSKEKNDQSFSNIKIITIARLNWVKGIDYLIETAHHLSKEGVDFEWLVVGGGSKQEEERYLYHIYEKRLRDKVKLLGRKGHQETLGLLNDTDLYVQTSLNEGFCNAVLEAQALGKLCIAFNVGGLSENIVENKSGWLVQNLQTKKLAEKIIDVINLPTIKKAQITDFAEHRVAEQFNIKKQQQEFIEFYKS